MPAIKTRSDNKRRRRAAGARAQQHQWLAANLDKSTLALGQGMDLKEYTSNAARFGFKLLTTGDKNAQGLAQLVGGYSDGLNTQKTGTFYAMANLTDTPNTSTQHAYVDRRSDMEKLRAGEKLSDKASRVLFTIKIKNSKNEYEATNIIVHLQARDADHGVFFGDRPLDNPGYSAIKLMAGGVGANQKNAAIDVVRVEQRLKYLGFPAMGAVDDGGQQPSLENNQIQNFKVDGHWGEQEARAAYTFYKVINYGSAQTGRSMADRPKKIKNPDNDAIRRSTYQINLRNAVNGFGFSAGTNATDHMLQYLNAYNAPHWMQFFAPGASTNLQLRGWTTDQTANKGGSVERFGTSWMHDLMAAAGQNAAGLRGANNTLKLTGSVDANHGASPFMHGSHDLGMAFDLGISAYISTGNQGNSTEPKTVAANAVGWSIANARTQMATSNGVVEDEHYTTTLPGGRTRDLGKNLQSSALAAFLSIYGVTRNDGTTAGSRGALTFTNGTTPEAANAIRSALFGTGEAGNGMVAGVLVGGTGSKNPQQNIRQVLANLGFQNDALASTTSAFVNKWQDHEHHFHIYLRPPAARDISPRALLAEPPPQTQQENSAMLSDMPAIPPQGVPVAIMQTVASKRVDNCWVVLNEKPAQSTVNIFRPVSLKISKELGFEGPDIVAPSGFYGVELISTPMHGTVRPSDASAMQTRAPSWIYEAHDGTYEGWDQAKFRIQAKGRSFESVVNFRVVTHMEGSDGVGLDKEGFDFERVRKELCRINKTAPQAGNASLEAHPAEIALWFESALRSAHLSQLSGVTYSFAPLPASTLGQTLGVGEGAQITLDDNAAGHGWYIDPTPLDNTDDYLPTSDPRLWQAKPGSAAEGKMDLLSVLLHELGHALGEEHSEHASDYMATSLQSGQRKLPSAQEIEHLLALSAALHPSKQPLPHVPHGFTAITSIASVEPPVSTTLCGGLGGTGLTS